MSIYPGRAKSTCSLGDAPLGFAASGTISALRKKVKQKNSEFKNQINPNIINSEFGTPARPQYDHKSSPYRCTSARFCSAFIRIALSSSRSTAAAPWNTRDTGSQVLSASSSPFQATLTNNSSLPPSGRRSKSTAFHGKRLRSGGGFACTTLAPH